MATYTELAAIANNNVLLDKMSTAVAIQADVIRQELDSVTNHANRLKWAKAALSDPRGMALKMTWAILAQNSSSTNAQILAATDAALLSAVAGAVNIFADGV